MINIYVGYDPREAVAYHTFCNSVLRRTTKAVSFTPLTPDLYGMDGRRDGSNTFIYSRFLVPFLHGFKGHALFVDGDMICNGDISELWDMRDHFNAVSVVKHDYKTKAKTKYLGAKNEDYPRKNWSSVILWNCGSHFNRVLTPEYVAKHDGVHLHRFQWIEDARISALPKEWNWLVGEYPKNPAAKLLHYTLGTPCFDDYKDCDHAEDWHDEFSKVIAPKE